MNYKPSMVDRVAFIGVITERSETQIATDLNAVSRWIVKEPSEALTSVLVIGL